MRKIMYILGVLLFCQPSVMAQPKIGTVGTINADILLLSPSVKANGMGQAGSAVVSSNSFFLNPSTLGLAIEKQKLQFSFYPSSSNLSDYKTFFNFSIAYPFIHIKSINSDFYLGGAYSFTSLTDGAFVERTYADGTIDGSWYTNTNKDILHHFVVSAVTKGKIDYGVGVAFKLLHQTAFPDRDNNFLFDFGGILRYNLEGSSNGNNAHYMNPAFSMAIRNLGTSVKLGYATYSLPRIMSLGFSLETGSKRKFAENLTAITYSLMPVVDIEKHRDDLWIYRFGLDFSLYEILNLRVGKIKSSIDDTDETTFGFSLSTFRLGKFRTLVTDGKNIDNESIPGYLYSKLNIEYNFASYDRYFTDEIQNYHELVFSFFL